MADLTLAFTTSVIYPDNAEGITLPVFLTVGDTTIPIEAKVDTGAELCLFRREHGEALGLVIEAGEHVVLRTLAGSLEAYGHEVSLRCCGIEFVSTVYFSKYLNLGRNILGRRGWLRKMRIGVVDENNLLYLSRCDD
jgi:hypothetical protein